jgi:L-fuconolactonase
MELPIEVVDAYVHCGLNKDHPYEVLAQTLQLAGVSRAVLVQHLGEYDNAYLGDIATANPNTIAAVALIDHRSATAEQDLWSVADSGHFRGLRVTDEALMQSPGLIAQAARLGLILMMSGLQGARDLLESQPDCRMVLTHLGRPNVSESPSFQSSTATLALAEYPGVYYQISGMKLWTTFPHEPLYPLLASAFSAFGESRLLWGSNYPVVGEVRDYTADLGLLLEGKLPLPEDAIPAIAGRNAAKLWFGSLSQLRETDIH